MAVEEACCAEVSAHCTHASKRSLLQQFACCVWPLVSPSRPAPAPQVILLALPGDERVEAVDQEGQAALAVLRALGMPTLVGLVQAPAAPGSKNALKERSAAKKHAGAAFAEHVSASCGCCRCAIGARLVSEGSSMAGAPDPWVLQPARCSLHLARPKLPGAAANACNGWIAFMRI